MRSGLKLVLVVPTSLLLTGTITGAGSPRGTNSSQLLSTAVTG
jgi:hypothetical protein